MQLRNHFPAHCKFIRQLCPLSNNTPKFKCVLNSVRNSPAQKAENNDPHRMMTGGHFYT